MQEKRLALQFFKEEMYKQREHVLYGEDDDDDDDYKLQARI